MSNENRTNINPPRRMRGPMGGGRMGSGEKAKDFKGTIGKLIRYIGNYKYGVFGVGLQKKPCFHLPGAVKYLKYIERFSSEENA